MARPAGIEQCSCSVDVSASMCLCAQSRRKPCSECRRYVTRAASPHVRSGGKWLTNSGGQAEAKCAVSDVLARISSQNRLSSLALEDVSLGIFSSARKFSAIRHIGDLYWDFELKCRLPPSIPDVVLPKRSSFRKGRTSVHDLSICKPEALDADHDLASARADGTRGFGRTPERSGELFWLRGFLAAGATAPDASHRLDHVQFASLSSAPHEHVVM